MGSVSLRWPPCLASMGEDAPSPPETWCARFGGYSGEASTLSEKKGMGGGTVWGEDQEEGGGDQDVKRINNGRKQGREIISHAVCPQCWAHRYWSPTSQVRIFWTKQYSILYFPLDLASYGHDITLMRTCIVPQHSLPYLWLADNVVPGIRGDIGFWYYRPWRWLFF